MRKEKYIPSKRLLMVYRLAFCLVLAGFFVGVGTLFLPEGEHALAANLISKVAFWTAFAAISAVFFANIFLWIGMLHFLVQHDARPAPNKIGWFVVVLLGLSYGAAIYYWAVYRRLLDIKNSESLTFAQ